MKEEEMNKMVWKGPEERKSGKNFAEQTNVKIPNRNMLMKFMWLTVIWFANIFSIKRKDSCEIIFSFFHANYRVFEKWEKWIEEKSRGFVLIYAFNIFDLSIAVIILLTVSLIFLVVFLRLPWFVCFSAQCSPHSQYSDRIENADATNVWEKN